MAPPMAKRQPVIAGVADTPLEQTVAIGQAVRVVFDKASEEITLPKFEFV